MKLALAAALAALPLAAAAQALPVPTDARFAATTLDVSADGEAHAQPDMASVSLGVTDQAPTAGAAFAANAAAMGRVIAAVKAQGIAERDIQTSNLSLEPQYAYDNGQAPRLTGYQAADTVTVTVRDLAKVGPLADAATAAGATNVGPISFGLVSSVPAENMARLAAVKALEDKVAMLADAAGYHIRRLVTLSESSASEAPPPRPFMAVARMAAAPATPVETGELTVRVTVTGEFELTR